MDDCDLGVCFIHLVVHFRGHDLRRFCTVHDRLYREARRTGYYRNVIHHYYSIMAAIIDHYYGGYFHFVPPQRSGQSRMETDAFLHGRIVRLLDHNQDKHCLDVGCGVGKTMLNVARLSNGKVTGITLAPSEASIANCRFVHQQLDNLCSIVVGDCSRMPIVDNAFDSAYAIYTLKYFVDLKPIFKQLARVLNSNGLFFVYDLVKTERYDRSKSEHRRVIEELEYSCGMPPLHTNLEMISVANEYGFELIQQIDLASLAGHPFHHCFSSSRFLMGLFESNLIDQLLSLGETVRLLPNGFNRFCMTFLIGTVLRIVQGGRMGILDGSNILLFRNTKSVAGQASVL